MFKNPGLENCKCNCPYCGELIEIVVDTSIDDQNYIEDCSVCCRPIVFIITSDPMSGEISLQALSEND
jgi:hypothetical protein